MIEKDNANTIIANADSCGIGIVPLPAGTLWFNMAGFPKNWINQEFRSFIFAMHALFNIPEL